MTCDFQLCGILTSVDSYKPVQPPLKLRNFKWRSVSSLTFIEYSSDEQRLWSDCAYAQAYLSLCSSHIPHCWKSHALAQLCFSWKWQLLSFLIWRSVIVINLNVKVKLIQHPPSSQPNGYKSVTIQNGWNNRISDGCVYVQIRRGLGMHLVIYSNHDTVLFLLIVPIKGRFVWDGIHCIYTERNF